MLARAASRVIIGTIWQELVLGRHRSVCAVFNNFGRARAQYSCRLSQFVAMSERAGRDSEVEDGGHPRQEKLAWRFRLQSRDK